MDSRPSDMNSIEVDELNVINPLLSQSSHVSPHNFQTNTPYLSNPFPGNSDQIMPPPSHFPIGYGFKSTNFNPHFQQTSSFQGLMNHPIFSYETQEAPVQKRCKRQKNSQKIPNKDPELHQPIRRNWTKEEDVALTKAWLHISIDPIIGVDQSSDKLWKRIHVIWKEYLTDDFLEDRPIRGLSKRWCTIQAAINKFHGIYEQLGRSPRSGTNSDDLKKDAHRVYKEMSIDNKPFLFEHCWDECKKNAKWCLQVTSSNLKKSNAHKSSASKSSSSPTTNEPIEVDTIEEVSVDTKELSRPLGRKISKEKKKMQGQDKSVVDILSKMQENMEQQTIFNQEELELKRENSLVMKKEYDLKEHAIKKDVEFKEKILILQEKELEMQKESQRRRNQQKMLNQDLSKMAPAARAIIERMQERIAKELDEEDYRHL